jgi:membrane associated rhomboid family serine protease
MTETGRGVRERLKLSNLPITIGVIALVGGFFVRVGFHTYPEGLSTFPYLLDPFFYFGTIFTHSGASHYVANMYFLVPAGIILTYLTSNREVLGVVLVSHLPTAAFCATIGLTALGAGAAAYGVLAAVLVRTTWFCAEEYSGAVRVASSIAVVVLSGVALTALVVVSGASQVAYIIPLSGFVLGGTFESLRVIYDFGYSEPERSPVPDDVYFEAPTFRSRWENMAGDKEEAKELEERYTEREAAPDDTYAGSRGRTRKD